MSVTRSYNKHTGTYYAYETTYEWSDEKQKKVQRKRCIGHFDPATGEVVPNGKVGRPSAAIDRPSPKDGRPASLCKAERSDVAEKLEARLGRMEGILQSLSAELANLRNDVDELALTGH